MIPVSILAQAQATRTFFEWGRIQSNLDWVGPIAAFVGLALLVRFWYRRDAAEIRPVVRVALTALRVLALAGLLWIYLQPQWRTEHDVTANSQAILLVDTSLSMGLADEAFPSAPSAPNRIDRVVQALNGERLLRELRRTHEVSIVRFDQQIQSIATLPRLTGDLHSNSAAEKTPTANTTSGAPQWSQVLSAQGLETRLGQALRDCINEQRAGPISGIILFTDGGQNSGISPRAALSLARQTGIRIHPVGLGSDRQPTNVRISDLVAPARAFPGDTYTLTGYLQSQGMAAQTARVELFSAPAADATTANQSNSRLEGTSNVRLAVDGEVTPVTFELTPGETGRRTLTLRVDAAEGDANPHDNQQQVDIEIVDQKTRILLFASGPTREYRFLDALLHRDNNAVVDIFLGTAQPGSAQEARQILEAFPTTRQQLDGYDLIVAIDPDWMSLDAQAIANLDRWVSEQAGGLIVIPGPIHGDSWAEKPELSKIRDLYPVEFRRRFSLTSATTSASHEPWPLEFTREGQEADFLWLADSAPASAQAWATFPGMYECFPVRGPKAGATVYARFSDPKAAAGSELPVYLCGQFYGSGRVFYLGSGEMWRLRGIDPNYFDQFYTKLTRYVSQGRWLRGSSRGILLTDRDRYYLGQQIALRAQLTDARLEPLQTAHVAVTAIRPDKTAETISLESDGTRPGNYSGQYVVRQEGAYRLELKLPDSENQQLTRRIQVRVPDLERENPRRNDGLLGEVAAVSGGHYYVGVEDALGLKGSAPVWQELPDRSLTHTQSEKPRPIWDNWQVLALIAGCLSLEWLVRRLMRLA